MISRMFSSRILTFTSVRTANYVTKAPKPEIPKNSLASVYSAQDQKENGIVYDRKPFKVTLQQGKTYHWCLCGRSKSQPLCDGTHKDVYLKITQRYDIQDLSMIPVRAASTMNWLSATGRHKKYVVLGFSPIRFKVEETKDYWLCNCKQTKNRPFCDGTHKQKEVQEATTIKV